MCVALAMDGLMLPDRTQSGFGVFAEVERQRFVFDDSRARIHLHQFRAGKIRDVIGRLAQSFADKLFQVVIHNPSIRRARPRQSEARELKSSLLQAVLAAKNIPMETVLIPMRGLQASPLGS